MQRFKLDRYKGPVEVIKQDSDIRGHIEDSFLVVKLEDKDGEIIFQVSNQTEQTGLDHIQATLLEIIDNVLVPSQKFPRPEKNMASNTKGDSFLPAVHKDDETYREVHEDVRQIIADNFVEIGKVTDIFKDFKFLLIEQL